MAKKILLADDSVTIQKIVELTFEGEGFDLEVVADGHEALKRAEASPPDIILADLTMPGLSGIELCRKIREKPDLSSIPVVLLTNSFEEFDRADGDAAGVAAYVEKPFESQALIDRVQDLLGEEGPQAELAAPTPDLRPPADEVDFISVEPEEIEPALAEAEREDLLAEFQQATAPAATDEEPDDILILEEVVEEAAEEPAPVGEEPQAAPEPPAEPEPVEALDEVEVTEEEPPPEAPTYTDEERPTIEPPPPPSPTLEEATAAAGAGLEEAIGDVVRSYIDQLINQAVEELTPTITTKVVERLEATFPPIAERIIRDEIEKLKRGE